MLGFTDEYTVTQLVGSSVTAGASIGSAATLSASCIDARDFIGKGALFFAITSLGTVYSLVPQMQFMDTSVYPSILSVGQADASGTWADFTTNPFTQLSTLAAKGWMNSIDWDAVEGRYVRVKIVNYAGSTCTAWGIAIGRKQEA